MNIKASDECTATENAFRTLGEEIHINYVATR
jgi:hypothetical protein